MYDFFNILCVLFCLRAGVFLFYCQEEARDVETQRQSYRFL
ncbi:hypothetical protein Barb6_01121 [Bacteroidales bacterium Barb6]|nr:hypothetical protein Barb6_01121 [Bacteroidales bacterium Barb6]